jgi:hypothetical protein
VQVARVHIMPHEDEQKRDASPAIQRRDMTTGRPLYNSLAEGRRHRFESTSAASQPRFRSSSSTLQAPSQPPELLAMANVGGTRFPSSAHASVEERACIPRQCSCGSALVAHTSDRRVWAHCPERCEYRGKAGTAARVSARMYSMSDSAGLFFYIWTHA